MSMWHRDPDARQLRCPCCLRWRSEPHPARAPAAQYARHLARTSCGDGGWVDPVRSYRGAVYALGALGCYTVAAVACWSLIGGGSL